MDAKLADNDTSNGAARIVWYNDYPPQPTIILIDHTVGSCAATLSTIDPIYTCNLRSSCTRHWLNNWESSIRPFDCMSIYSQIFPNLEKLIKRIFMVIMPIQNGWTKTQLSNDGFLVWFNCNNAFYDKWTSYWPTVGILCMFLVNPPWWFLC